MSFNPNQPRDKEGQWSSMGGPSATQKHAIGEAFQHNTRAPIDAKHSALLSKLGGAGLTVKQAAARLNTTTTKARGMLDALTAAGHAELGKSSGSGTHFRQRKPRPSMQSTVNKLNSFYAGTMRPPYD